MRNDSGENQCAIIGISMLNAHFSAENIHKTLHAVKASFKKVVFMLPDKPSEHTLKGYGYNELEAEKTVRRKFSVLERDCRQSIAALDLPDVDIMRWEQFDQKEAYEKMLETMNELYKKDTAFQADVRKTTETVYKDSQFPKKNDMTIEQQVDAGILFLLNELAFILSSPELLQSNGTTYLYHKEMPVLSNLLDGSYKFTPPKNVQFQRMDIHEEL